MTDQIYARIGNYEMHLVPNFSKPDSDRAVLCKTGEFNGCFVIDGWAEVADDGTIALYTWRGDKTMSVVDFLPPTTSPEIVAQRLYDFIPESKR